MFDLALAKTPEQRARTSRIARQAKFEITVAIYAEHDGVGMGLLSTGQPFLTQRGLAVLCGVQNAHIGNISRDWDSTKPRVRTIKARLGFTRAAAHRVLTFEGRRMFAYDAAVSQAVLDYYALDAASPQPEARRNRARFADAGLKAWIAGHFTAPAAEPQPIRFVPTVDADDDAPHPVTAFLTQVWALHVLSFWMAISHVEELRRRVAAAPWNRLGLYLPLKAFLEIQAEAARRAAVFRLR